MAAVRTCVCLFNVHTANANAHLLTIRSDLCCFSFWPIPNSPIWTKSMWAKKITQTSLSNHLLFQFYVSCILQRSGSRFFPYARTQTFEFYCHWSNIQNMNVTAHLHLSFTSKASWKMIRLQRYKSGEFWWLFRLWLLHYQICRFWPRAPWDRPDKPDEFGLTFDVMVSCVWIGQAFTMQMSTTLQMSANKKQWGRRTFCSESSLLQMSFCSTETQSHILGHLIFSLLLRQ